MQAASDIFLGWTEGQGGRHFYLRQLRDIKIKPLVEIFNPSTMLDYAALCGWTLARAHARSGDAAMIAGYLGKHDVFDRAIARFSFTYADLTARDHRAFVDASSRRTNRSPDGRLKRSRRQSAVRESTPGLLDHARRGHGTAAGRDSAAVQGAGRGVRGDARCRHRPACARACCTTTLSLRRCTPLAWRSRCSWPGWNSTSAISRDVRWSLGVGGWSISVLAGITVVGLLHVIPAVHAPMMVDARALHDGARHVDSGVPRRRPTRDAVRAPVPGGRHAWRGRAHRRHVAAAVAALQHVAGGWISRRVSGVGAASRPPSAWAHDRRECSNCWVARCTRAVSCRCAFRCWCWPRCSCWPKSSASRASSARSRPAWSWDRSPRGD